MTVDLLFPSSFESAMNHKIVCPLCQHGLSIKDPKPGKYKPKCSGCGNPFVIVVEAGEPTKITVSAPQLQVSGFEVTAPPDVARITPAAKVSPINAIASPTDVTLPAESSTPSTAPVGFVIRPASNKRWSSPAEGTSPVEREVVENFPWTNRPWTRR